MHPDRIDIREGHILTIQIYITSIGIMPVLYISTDKSRYTLRLGHIMKWNLSSRNGGAFISSKEWPL
jgi:hypothetical protein